MFGPESVTGTYAVIVSGHGGQAPFAALGVLRFDGAGRVGGFLLENRQGERYGDPNLVRVDIDAGYAMEADGLGTLAEAAGGEAIAYLAVRADTVEGIVPKLGLVFRDLDAGTGALRTGLLTRLPDGATFGTRAWPVAT